ncbi:molybdopterin molybdotransferase [Agromyces terreus]|uniref:Molybdopterin molybdenumtransferase n=1 Tax=Agromyces terreus TaxID=424795 RepID=A0A9X2H172_9MICO|nr:gephyrin-like molybdotransferase Glp [Agromyces terreus]MCP2370713.1 molybdopterin molybdotransferase [Agromyces terreus]
MPTTRARFHESATLIPVAQHLEAVLAAVRGSARPAGVVEQVRLADAAGRTLATDVDAVLASPPFDNAAMDGFAVRWADVASASPAEPATLTVVGDHAAGSADPASARPLGAGEAARIMTGAQVPAGADTVVPVERTDRGEDADGPGGVHRVRVFSAPDRGRHIRRAGEDLRVGDPLLEAGTLLGPRQVAGAATAGHASLPVVRMPRVSVVATGSELTEPGETLAPGGIPDSNSLLLAGLVREAGCAVVEIVRMPDDADVLRAWISEREPCDAIVFTGGVSIGAYDVVRRVLGELGTVDFVRVAMQPGSPQAFGFLADGSAVFGLPGNPVAAAAAFEVFVRPALLAMQGRREVQRRRVRAGLVTGWDSPRGRLQLMPVSFVAAQDADGAGPEPLVRPATRGGAASHLSGGLAGADGFAIVPEAVERVEPGGLVDVLVLP